MRKNRIADEKKIVRARCDEIRARIRALGYRSVPKRICDAPYGTASDWIRAVEAAHLRLIVKQSPGATLTLKELKARESVLNALYLGIA